jgi:hypothetical protein
MPSDGALWWLAASSGVSIALGPSPGLLSSQADSRDGDSARDPGSALQRALQHSAFV